MMAGLSGSCVKRCVVISTPCCHELGTWERRAFVCAQVYMSPRAQDSLRAARASGRGGGSDDDADGADGGGYRDKDREAEKLLAQILNKPVGVPKAQFYSAACSNPNPNLTQRLTAESFPARRSSRACLRRPRDLLLEQQGAACLRPV